MFLVKKVKQLFFISTFSCAVNTYAQQVNIYSLNFRTNLFIKQAPLIFINTTNYIAPIYSSLKINPQTKLPLFCQMEANLHKHLKVWMVFRAGNDEDYRKFIAR